MPDCTVPEIFSCPMGGRDKFIDEGNPLVLEENAGIPGYLPGFTPC